jgi:hypothetical protein
VGLLLVRRDTDTGSTPSLSNTSHQTSEVCETSEV